MRPPTKGLSVPTTLLALLLLAGCDSVEKAMDPNGTSDPAGYRQTATPDERNDLVTVPPDGRTNTVPPDGRTNTVQP